MPRYRTDAIRGPSAYTRRPVAIWPDDAERWAEFCATVTDRIEQIRASEAPERCPTCDCTAHPPVRTRRCSFCGITKALAAFSRNRSQPLGRAYGCKDCRRKREVQRQRQLKLRAVRKTLGLRAS